MSIGYHPSLGLWAKPAIDSIQESLAAWSRGDIPPMRSSLRDVMAQSALDQKRLRTLNEHHARCAGAPTAKPSFLDVVVCLDDSVRSYVGAYCSASGRLNVDNPDQIPSDARTVFFVVPERWMTSKTLASLSQRDLLHRVSSAFETSTICHSC